MQGIGIQRELLILQTDAIIEDSQFRTRRILPIKRRELIQGIDNQTSVEIISDIRDSLIVQAIRKQGNLPSGIKVTEDVAADMLLIDFVRAHGCKSVKRGCETSNCGLCTVFLDEKPVLSCSVLAARASGHSITTLEGLQEEAAEFGGFIADQGAEQCGFCNPGFIMNALALFRENPYPSEEEVKEYLSGNLCRCSGYEGQLRGIMNFLAWKKQKEAAE